MESRHTWVLLLAIPATSGWWPLIAEPPSSPVKWGVLMLAYQSESLREIESTLDSSDCESFIKG